MKDNNRFRSFLIMTAGVAAVSICFAATGLAEKNKDKNKNKNKDPFTTQMEQEIKKEEAAVKGEVNKEKDKIVDHGSTKANDAVNVFSKTEKDAIQSYYSIQNQSLPPGLSKKVAEGGSLPPGWQKKVNKGEVVPADIYKYAEPLPKDIILQLPPAAPGTSLMKIDNRIVKVADATKTIIDVIDLP